jgi:PD-(D/E)XK nuclease superfamily
MVDQATRTFRLSQSWLQDFNRCPERARKELLQPSIGYNDATACGTALHKFMEQRLSGSAYRLARTNAIAWLESVSSLEDFRWLKVKKPETLFAHLEACIEGFDRHVLPQVPPGGMAEENIRSLLVEHEGWSVILDGTPDYLDPFGRLWDWKTASSEYNAYEASNWAIQPTAYTFLASRLTGREVTEFTYAVAVKPHGYVQFIDIERRQSDWDWLGRIALGALGMVRHMLSVEWPVNHSHYLCSPRWCPYWDECRGMYALPDEEVAIHPSDIERVST